MDAWEEKKQPSIRERNLAILAGTTEPRWWEMLPTAQLERVQRLVTDFYEDSDSIPADNDAAVAEMIVGTGPNYMLRNAENYLAIVAKLDLLRGTQSFCLRRKKSPMRNERGEFEYE